MKILFVYGTLKREQFNSYKMEKSIFLKEIKVSGYKMFSRKYTGYYPVAIRSNNKNDIIVGELYKIPDADFKRIEEDELEHDYTLGRLNRFKFGNNKPYIFFKTEDDIDLNNYEQIIDGNFKGFIEYNI